MLKKYLQKHEYSNNISAKTSVFKKYLDKIMNTQKNISAKNMNTQKNISEKTRVLYTLYICYSNTYICRRYHQYKMVTIGTLKTGSAVILE
jgi:hypothetical protein